jgi:ribosomal-protein-alanine N-acetyltransferase
VSGVLATTDRVALRRLAPGDASELLALAHESRDLHRPWAYPPERRDQLEDLLVRSRRDDFESLLVCRTDDSAIAGVFNVSQIVRGAFQSAFWAITPTPVMPAKGSCARGSPS